MTNPADTVENREWVTKLAQDIVTGYKIVHGSEPFMSETRKILFWHIDNRFPGQRWHTERENFMTLVDTMMQEEMDRVMGS